MSFKWPWRPARPGILRLGKSATLGGHLDEFGVYNWDPEAVVAELELSADAGPNDGTLRLLMLAGRRVTGLADVLTGMLPGWHNRARGWWADQSGGDVATLLSIGICDAVGPVRGEHSAFTEMFEEARLPAQAVFVPNHLARSRPAPPACSNSSNARRPPIGRSATT